MPADVLLHPVRAVLDESLAFTGLQKMLVLNSIMRTIQMQANVHDVHVVDAHILQPSRSSRRDIETGYEIRVWPSMRWVLVRRRARRYTLHRGTRRRQTLYPRSI